MPLHVLRETLAAVGAVVRVEDLPVEYLGCLFVSMLARPLLMKEIAAEEDKVDIEIVCDLQGLLE